VNREVGYSPAPRGFSADVEKVFELIQSDILGEKFETLPQDYFTLTTEVIDQGYKVMFDTLIPQFEQQLNARKASAQSMLQSINWLLPASRFPAAQARKATRPQAWRHRLKR